MRHRSILDGFSCTFSLSHGYYIIFTNMLKRYGFANRWRCVPNRLRHNMAETKQSCRYIWLSLWSCRRSHCMASDCKELLRRDHCRDYWHVISNARRQSGSHHDWTHCNNHNHFDQAGQFRLGNHSCYQRRRYRWS